MKVVVISMATLFVIIGISVFSLVILDRVELRREFESMYALDSLELQAIRHGDVIMRKGFGMVSQAIAARLDEKYSLSHCGVVVERAGKWHVIHAVASDISEVDGMQIHALDEFVRQSQHGSIVVTRLHDQHASELLARGAEEYLEARIGFDKNFDLSDSTRFYCSELIWRCLKNRTDIDLFEGMYDNVDACYSFNNFLNPKYFCIIINHHEALQRAVDERGQIGQEER